MLRECEGTLLKVCLYFTRRRSDDIRDLYQEIACTLWEAWPTFRGESKVSTWATSIALNVAGQEVRRRRRRSQFVQLDESFYNALAAESANAPYIRLYSIIDQLDEEDQKMIFLYLERKSYSEIAEICGTTEAAAKQKIYRLKNKMLAINSKLKIE